MAGRICTSEKDLAQTRLLLEAVKGDLLESGAISELNLKVAGPVPSEPVFPLEQVHDHWEEIERHYDEV